MPRSAAAPLRAGQPGPEAVGPESLGVGQLLEQLAGAGLGWRGGDLGALWNTCSARTHLQPQLHKAVGPGGLGGWRHRRLKDWILFCVAQVREGGREREGE